MASVEQLRIFRDRLQEARYSGLREVRDSTGETVQYKSDSEMARALAAIDLEIAGLQRTVARLSYPQTSKGV